MLSIQAVRGLPHLHCSLHYLFIQASPLFPHGVTMLPCSDGVCHFPLYSSFVKNPFVFFAVHETDRIFLTPFI